MSNEKRLIDANAIVEKFSDHKALFLNKMGGFQALLQREKGRVDELDNCIADIINAPTVDAVSRCVHDQVRWERDVAIEQLESYGVSFGEKAEVAKVVHGRWDTEKCNHKPHRIKNPEKWVIYKCSVCGYSNGRKKNNYCPNCGADMRERKDNGM